MATPVACQTAGCYNISSWFNISMSPRYQFLNTCIDNAELSCGGFNTAFGNSVLPHRKVISLQTLMRDEVDNIIVDLLHKPYSQVSRTLERSDFKLQGSPAVDRANRNLAARYHRSCVEAESNVEEEGGAAFLELMDEVNRPFARMDVFEEDSNYIIKNVSGVFSDPMRVPEIDTSEKMWGDEDWNMVRDANTNLARLGIFPFVKMTVQKSMIHADRNAVVLTPFYEPITLEPKQFWDKDHRLRYPPVLKLFLERAHALQLRNIQNLNDVSKNLVWFERDLLNTMPLKPRREMLMIHRKIREVSVSALAEIAPDLRLEGTIVALGEAYNNTFRTVEVVHPKIISAINGVVASQSRETIRSWMLLQAYVQTIDVWEMQWVKRWQIWTAKINGVLRKVNNETHAEKCMLRAQRHFGHIIDSLYIRKEYSHRITKAVESLAETILLQWKDMAKATDWISDNARNFNFEKIVNMTVSVGFQQKPDLLKPESIAEYYTGAEVRVGGHNRTGAAPEPSADASFIIPSTLKKPRKWRHLNDYFMLERWRIEKVWSKSLEKVDERDEWPVGARSDNIEYSYLQNQLIIPAGALRQPLYTPDAPAWYAYAGIGTSIGREAMRAIDGVGWQHQANGSVIGDEWTSRDREKYWDRLQCFWGRSRKKFEQDEPGYLYSTGIDEMWEGIVREQEGMDASWRAWKAATANQTELSLPGLEGFGMPRLYWIARTMPFCSVMPWSRFKVFEAEIVRGPRPPVWKRRDEPMLDFAPYRETVSCDCANCAPKDCRIFGQPAPKGG